MLRITKKIIFAAANIVQEQCITLPFINKAVTMAFNNEKTI